MSVDLAHGVPDLGPEDKGRLNWSPKVNWVEKRGGLPPYINSVANALVRSGMTRQRAIQVAVNTIKKACATGLWGGQKRKISGAIRAAACAAAARWEAMKVSASVPSDQRMAIELATLWNDEGTLELAWSRLVARRVIELAGPSTMERKQAASKGQALPARNGGGGRFPVRNGSDLRKAIRAVGRARDSSGQATEAERRKVRRYIIRRARTLGLSNLIPDNWQSDGSLAS